MSSAGCSAFIWKETKSIFMDEGKLQKRNEGAHANEQSSLI